MDLLLIFLIVIGVVLYLAIGLLALLRCEKQLPAAMNDVVGFGLIDALVCWLIWPWTALAAWSLHRSQQKTSGAWE